MIVEAPEETIVPKKNSKKFRVTAKKNAKKYLMRKSGTCFIQCHNEMKHFFETELPTLITNSIFGGFVLSVIKKTTFRKQKSF